MSFMKRHWFGLVLGALVLVYIIMFVLVLISPKKDLQKRGFVKCSEAFIIDAHVCKGSWCLIKSIFKNNICDIKIIYGGFEGWIKGQEATPWSTYIYEPELKEVEEMDEELSEFYDDNPNLIYDIEKLKQLNEELIRAGEETSELESE